MTDQNPAIHAVADYEAIAAALTAAGEWPAGSRGRLDSPSIAARNGFEVTTAAASRVRVTYGPSVDGERVWRRDSMARWARILRAARWTVEQYEKPSPFLMVTGKTAERPCSARNIPGLPLSHACRDGFYSACTGYSGGHDTYLCGHRRHWCPSGDHPREQCPGQCATGTEAGQ